MQERMARWAAGPSAWAGLAMSNMIAPTAVPFTSPPPEWPINGFAKSEASTSVSRSADARTRIDCRLVVSLWV
jgi:hypothetical protein